MKNINKRLKKVAKNLEKLADDSSFQDPELVFMSKFHDKAIKEFDTALKNIMKAFTSFRMANEKEKMELCRDIVIKMQDIQDKIKNK